ncbi:DUF4239 domain-containing protein [Roseococcus sp. SDR]|uniref:bestrophin-like domain n=1 Tax=Roseococcus sp. SDR TaxID=2835532 RepID=UPI001BCCC7D1|nr:DUF4239 domain-containing protein [Roseococcus sp. SDR]MBS7790230.1 DUF4239 domain-containing protein [Roseococcus sp. SDR]MBV1845544.1 DUF4239 domain-containing protein [Roseococcus sp. SDR]
MLQLLDLAHAVPNWVVFVTVTAVLIGLGLTLPLLARALRGQDTDDAANRFTLDGIRGVSTMLALILGFSLNQVLVNFREASELVTREASVVNQLDRGLLRLGVPEFEQLRPVLLEYVRVTVTEEWPLMARGQRSEAAQQLFNQLQMVVRTTDVGSPRQQALYTEILRMLEQQSDVREARFQATRERLPELFWYAILMPCLLLLWMHALTDTQLYTRVVKVAMMGTLGTLIALVMVLDRPFRGETSVTPYALERAIERMQARR